LCSTRGVSPFAVRQCCFASMRRASVPPSADLRTGRSRWDKARSYSESQVRYRFVRAERPKCDAGPLRRAPALVCCSARTSRRHPAAPKVEWHSNRDVGGTDVGRRAYRRRGSVYLAERCAGGRCSDDRGRCRFGRGLLEHDDRRQLHASGPDGHVPEGHGLERVRSGGRVHRVLADAERHPAPGRMRPQVLDSTDSS
jgi:hypothetical protein